MSPQPGTPSTPLDSKSAVAKFASLITETTVEDDEPPAKLAAETPPAEPAVPPSEPAPPPSESDEPAPDEEDKLFTVQVDGETLEVDEEELKSGYRLAAHNTRTAQSLAEEKRALETELQAVQRERAEYQQGIAQLRQGIEQLQGEPDWVDLRTKLDPGEFLKQKADWEASKANLERIKAREDEVAQQAAKAQAEQFQKYRRAEQDKLLNAIPEWSDADKAKAEHAKLVSVAKQYGFSEQEVLSVTDHRAILLLRDAMRYRELHREPNAQTKAKVSPIKTAKPGTPERPRPNEKHQKLIERVAKTGRQQDAMAAILEALPD